MYGAMAKCVQGYTTIYKLVICEVVVVVVGDFKSPWTLVTSDTKVNQKRQFSMRPPRTTRRKLPRHQPMAERPFGDSGDKS